VPLVEGIGEEWILYCSCGRPATSSRWSSTELKMYAVSDQAFGRGYGPPEEIVRAGSVRKALGDDGRVGCDERVEGSQANTWTDCAKEKR
jgi:hypothetical protein